MECAAQGVVEAQHVDALRELLQGLCGTPLLPVNEHELVLKSAPGVGAIPSEVRLLCSLSEPTPVWSILHIGGAMRGAGAEQLPALVRPRLSAPARGPAPALALLAALGLRLDHELLREGFAFALPRGPAPLRVAVTRVLRLPEGAPLAPALHVVDVTAPATPETYARVAEGLLAFAEHLAPILRLSKPGQVTGVVPTANTAATAVCPPRQ